MSDLDHALAEGHEAVNDLGAACDRCGGIWTVSPAPGRWSPSQIVEHVGRTLEESARIVAGERSKFPTFPRFVRPIVRAVFFRRVIRSGHFPKGKTTKALNPLGGAPTPAAGRIRIETAMRDLDRASRACAQAGRLIDHPIFGYISPADGARFQALHVRHHLAQMPDGDS